jgi:two-component system, LytTR family, response regulator
MYTALIADDEPAQQEILINLLQHHVPQIKLLDVCSTVSDAVGKIELHKPQLLFLDVMMPPDTGFDILNRVSYANFETIFTTSYQEFAMRALKLSAVDYLLKPFGEEELLEAILKFEKRITGKNSAEHIQHLLTNLKTSNLEETKIALPTQTGYVFAQVKEIVHCMSDNTYTTFYFNDKSKLIVSKSIKDCEELLVHFNFFRTHSRHLINMQCIKEYIKGEGGQVRLTDGTMVDVARNRREDFVARLVRV